MNVIGEVLLRSVTSVPKVVSLWRRFPIGSVALRTRYGAWSRAQYAYGTFHAAQQAKLLGLDGISVIEFGVDRGDGLLALESIAREVAHYFGIRISVLGFDTGEGMPSPADYRDLPYVWGKGFYRMDEAKLRKQLSPGTARHWRRSADASKSYARACSYRFCRFRLGLLQLHHAGACRLRSTPFDSAAARVLLFRRHSLS